ncbi:MAG: FAD binding domain-containing protein [Acidobacteriota bacterium]
MLRLPTFTLHQPRTLAEAARILHAEGAAEGGPVRAVAGGTDLWPNMKRRHQKAAQVVSLMHLPELRSISNGDGVRLGATATLTEVAENPLVRSKYPDLAKAVASISAPVLRNMGTIGGNVCIDTRCTYYNQNEEWRRAIDFCMKEEGHVCWVAPNSPRCWAVSSSDSAPMLLALGARVRLVSHAGERVEPLEALYRDDGIAYLTKRPDELVTEILLPMTAEAGRCRTGFEKIRRRGAIDFAVLTVAAAVWTNPLGVVTCARLHLGAVASWPVPCAEANAALEGSALSEETITAAAKLARQSATPMDNTDFQAQWRGVMVERTVERVLRRML